MTRTEVLAVRETPQLDVVRAILDLYRGRGFQAPDHRGIVPQDELRTFEVSPLREQWVLVFPEEDRQTGGVDALEIGKALGADVVRLVSVVGSPLVVELYRGGALAGAHVEGTGAPAALLSVARRDDGRDEAARILRGATGWEDLHRVAEALGITSTRDAEHIQDASLDPEEAGYRRLVLRKPAAFGFLHRLRLLFQKPSLSVR